MLKTADKKPTSTNSLMFMMTSIMCTEIVLKYSKREEEKQNRIIHKNTFKLDKSQANDMADAVRCREHIHPTMNRLTLYASSRVIMYH